MSKVPPTKKNSKVTITVQDLEADRHVDLSVDFDPPLDNELNAPLTAAQEVGVGFLMYAQSLFGGEDEDDEPDTSAGSGAETGTGDDSGGGSGS